MADKQKCLSKCLATNIFKLINECLSLNTFNMIKKNNRKIGRIGEDIAVEFLIKNKYKILFRNYYLKFDEIDIIAKSFDGVLVFIEVKTLRNNGETDLMPEDNMTKNKIKKISRACRLFSGYSDYLIDKEKGWRIDLVAVTLNEDGSRIETINHYKNITSSE
jgi:putative endonuclease